MTRLFSLLFLLFSLVTFAQEDEEVHSIFFEFDKYNLKEEQANAVVAFVSKIDITKASNPFKFLAIVMIVEKMLTIILYLPIELIPLKIN